LSEVPEGLAGESCSLRELLRDGGFGSAGIVSLGVFSLNDSSFTDGGPETELASVKFAVGVLDLELALEADLDLEERLDSCFGSPVDISSSITSTTSPSGATTS
jgi:hypothetical protein